MAVLKNEPLPEIDNDPDLGGVVVFIGNEG
jgi:hypothetical protein